MQLTDEQKTKVAEWIANGLSLSEIQDRMGTEWDVRMTYMEARMLISDLQLLPKEKEAPAAEKNEAEAEHVPGAPDAASHETGAAHPEGAAPGGKVTVTLDTLARPGAMVSGRVNFSDGQTASWQMDQYGRFGMIPPYPGYKPPETDIPEFQMLIDRELSRMGF